MITIIFLLLVLAAGVESLICPTGQQPCGSTGCYDPTIQGCSNGGTTIQCINSCNGTCYSNSQYCYNNTKVCNNGELVCNVKAYSPFTGAPLGPTCYNSSGSICSNNVLCSSPYSCGTQCLNDSNSTCANNRTICYGFNFWNYWYTNRYLNVCGPQQTCYDNTTSICLDNNGTVCPIGNQLCSGVCYNPQSQYCTGGNNTIYCLNNPSSSNCPTTSAMWTSSTSNITTTTTATMISSSCCAVQNCTTNSDCCLPGSVECQCYRHNQTDLYGSCVNPYVIPICGDSCPVPAQGKCKYDSDCCKCQCAEIRFTDSDGQLITKKQCAQR